MVTPERETSWLAPTEPFELEVDGRRLVGFAGGEGPTVLLVHGWAGRGSQMGAFISPLIERGFRVVGVDLPGHGASDGRRSSLPQCARAVEELLRQCAPVHSVIAHSMGGAVTTNALSRFGSARSLIYIGAADDVGELTRRASGEMGFDVALYDEFQRLAERRLGIHFSDYLISNHAPEQSEAMLAVHADREVPLDDARRWVEAWPGARLDARSGLGHTRILRDPDVVSTVTEFVSDRRAASAA